MLVPVDLKRHGSGGLVQAISRCVLWQSWW